MHENSASALAYLLFPPVPTVTCDTSPGCGCVVPASEQSSPDPASRSDGKHVLSGGSGGSYTFRQVEEPTGKKNGNGNGDSGAMGMAGRNAQGDCASEIACGAGGENNAALAHAFSLSHLHIHHCMED